MMIEAMFKRQEHRPRHPNHWHRFIYWSFVMDSVMHIRLRIFTSKPEKEPKGGERYVSHLQRDIRRYEGWSKEMVESDYKASKTVHTIMTIGYMEYADDVLVLTDRGSLVMRSVEGVSFPTE